MFDNLCKILIVDDEYLLRQGVKYMVDWNKEGFHVVGEASNGKEAIELIEKFKPHIVISDVVMPVMDGVDLTKIIKRNYPEIQVVILSSHSDFNYVKDTFKLGVNDYILKPKLNPDELILLLKNIASNIPNFSFSALENNNLTMQHFLQKLISNFDEKLDKETIINSFPYDSFLLLGDNIKKLTSGNSIKITSLPTILSKWTKTYLEGLIYYKIDASSDLFLIIINFNNKDFSKVLHKINQMTIKISTEVHGIFFVISNIFNSIYELKSIYNNNFKPLLGYKFYFTNTNIISYESLPKIIVQEKFDFKYYSEQIYGLNIDRALSYLREYLYSSIKNFSLNEFELKTFFQNALYNIINILDELNFNIEELNNSKSKYFEHIDETKSTVELLSLLDVITKDINELLSNQQNRFNDHIINQIIGYISEHYAEPLTLKQVADKFHFNYYYLSSYFSSHNKEGFSEYLNKIRVDKAAELLRNENIPVSEISFMVGYSDHSYFCKVFKKFKNLTPSTFRKKVINVKEGKSWLEL